MKTMDLFGRGRLRILCFIFLFSPWQMAVVGEALKPVSGRSADCPLNLTELDSHPWLIQQCSHPDKSHCCESIMDLIRILLFSWLHTTRSFLLPNTTTANVCLHGFQRRLRAKGISDEVFQGCKLQANNFVSDTESCHRIKNLSGFERAVDPSAMQQNCNGSDPVLFQCYKCIGVMAIALRQLLNKGDGEKSNCALFVKMYVGGGINSYEDLGPDAALCLLSAQNLVALAQKNGSLPVDQQVGKRRKATKIALEVAIPVASLIVLLVSIYSCFKWRRLYDLRGSNRIKLLRRQTDLLRESVNTSTGLAFFSLSEIEAWTENFSASNLIGEGGFSTVYRGTFRDGSQIAVKRFKDSTIKGDTDFMHEVQVISSVKHRNLLPLRGYSIGSTDEGLHEQLLVYDFMENGSLADCLFNSNKPCLSWTERYNIAVGIARGLAYLHEDAKPAIIHRDVKAANVLLDADLNPLVGDFGLAKFNQDVDKTHYTTRAVGTFGYVAPEYALYGHLSDRSDVYSFGIVLLELISGRKVLDSTSGIVEHLLISDWACELMQEGRSEEVIDHRIRESGPKESMERVILLGLQCAHPRVACRPFISRAQAILEGIDRALPDLMSISCKEMKSEESSSDRMKELNWLIFPDMEGRMCYRSMTMNSISMDSYQTGR
eukprot:Gb_04631 [translate_table: standard]